MDSATHPPWNGTPSVQGQRGGNRCLPQRAGGLAVIRQSLSSGPMQGHEGLCCSGVRDTGRLNGALGWQLCLWFPAGSPPLQKRLLPSAGHKEVRRAPRGSWRLRLPLVPHLRRAQAYAPVSYCQFCRVPGMRWPKHKQPVTLFFGPERPQASRIFSSRSSGPVASHLPADILEPLGPCTNLG